MHRYYQHMSGLLQDHVDALDAVYEHEPVAEDHAFRAKLIAFGRVGIVVLRDPTDRLPLPR